MNHEVDPDEPMITLDGVFFIIDNAREEEGFKPEVAQELLDTLQAHNPEAFREAELRYLQGRPSIQVKTYKELCESSN